MKSGTILLALAATVLLQTPLHAGPVEPQGGLVVCIGADAFEDMDDHWGKANCTFHGLVTSTKSVEQLRAKIRKAGVQGRVSVSQFDGKTLPYIGNLVNMVVIRDTRCEIRDEEVERVLAPYGVAIGPKGLTCIPHPASRIGNGFVSFTKPFPSSMDEWPQYLCGADNNAVAQDTVVGPPRHVQWISDPAWTRSHMGAASIAAMVSAGGRLFTIEDRETAENPYLPAKWKLIARDAFNGITLWTMDYPSWDPITVYIKTFHAQPQRRLAAIGDILYCTPGLNAPVTALDAATGAKIRAYPATKRTQEFAYHEGTLYVVVGDRMQEQRGSAQKTTKGKKKGKAKQKSEVEEEPIEEGVEFNGYGFAKGLYNPKWPTADVPKNTIIAIDAKTGKELWRSDEVDRYTGCSMALKGNKLVYQSANGLVCLDAKSGKSCWTVEKPIPYGRGAMPHTLVLTDDGVYSEEGKNVYAYSLADGSPLWEKPLKARKGYQAASDLLVASGALWMCGAGGTPTSYDLKTGELIKTIPQKLSEPMGHDRCFRNYITERYFINSKTGGPDCLDLESSTEYPNPFTRATCSIGHLPCNGLIYAGPYACQCHVPVGLHNFNAYYTNEDSLTAPGQVIEVARKVRVEKGPAFGGVISDQSSVISDQEWPTYRHGVDRLSASAVAVPAKGMSRRWQEKLAAPTTAPVIAGDKVFIAETDAHTLHALDASTGKRLWNYVADGRIDSPPTYHRGLVLFGSRDGWVHCVRASDGVLAWRFRDLPDKLICAFGQLESAWPIHGSVLIKKDVAYVCAGRSSYLDGGLFLYGLNPVTGEMVHQRQFYGPYGDDQFPIMSHVKTNTRELRGTTADVMSAVGNKLYIRHKAFNLDLSDATADKHLLATAGMLESKRAHREYTLVSEAFNDRKTWTSRAGAYPVGDIIASDGTDYYSVFGMPVNRHSWYDPRKDQYALQARTLTPNGWSKKWEATIPLTGKALLLAGDVVFVTGAPLVFKPNDLAATYEGRCGAILWAASASDGSKLAEYKLDTLPAWDGMAAAYGKLFISNQDGSVECWGAR